MRVTAASRYVKAAPIILLALAVIVIVAVFASKPVPTGTPRQLTILGGELRDDSETGGFALLGEEIISPGPTIRLKKGDKVTITFINVHGYASREMIPHNFVVVAEKKETAEPLWGAKIGESTGVDTPRPLGGGSVTFTPDTVGEFLYVCAVPGHIERGMFGSLIVEE